MKTEMGAHWSSFYAENLTNLTRWDSVKMY